MNNVATRSTSFLQRLARRSAPMNGRTPVPVSVIIPCCNEEAVLPSLAETLASVEATLADRYEIEFLVVDDGSTDSTWALMLRYFGGKANYCLLRHDQNQGLAAAIRTGIHRAQSEIVCSMDSDCTYDP